jgi:hypothetical protein
LTPTHLSDLLEGTLEMNGIPQVPSAGAEHHQTSPDMSLRLLLELPSFDLTPHLLARIHWAIQRLREAPDHEVLAGSIGHAWDCEETTQLDWISSIRSALRIEQLNGL